MDRSPQLSPWFRTLAKGFALAPAIASLGSLALWILGKPGLAAFGQGKVPMAPSTALLIGLVGLAIFFSAHRPHHLAIHRASFWIISLSALAALGLGILSLLGIRPEAEHLGLFGRTVTMKGGEIALGHISPLTAVAFLLGAISYLTAPTPFTSRFRSGALAAGFAALLSALSLLTLLMYFFGVPVFYGTSFIPPALLTIAAFIALGVALIIRALPYLGFMQGLSKAEQHAGVYYLGAFTLAAVALLSASFFYFRYFESGHRAELDKQLSAVVELKANQLVEYRKERFVDALLTTNAPGLSELVAQAFRNPEGSQAALELQSWMDQIRSFTQYDLVRLVDARGKVRVSSPADGEPISSELAPGISEVLRSGKVRLHDFYLSDRDLQSHLAMLIPILEPRSNHKVLGILALRIDPRLFLFPFLKQWPVASETAETLLVRREGDEVVFLNDLRFMQNAPLHLRIPLSSAELPAAQAVLGRAGIFEGKDYRGKQVYAALHQIPSSSWSLVARMDIAEGFAPVRARVWQLLGLNLVLLLATASGLGFLWHQQRLRILQAGMQVEQERQKTEAKYRSIFDNTADGIFQVTPDGRLLLANPALARILGFDSPEELLRQRTDLGRQGYLHPERREEFKRLIERDGHVSSFEFEALKKNGSVVWVSESSHVVRDDAGRITHYEGLLEDITERKQIEDALRENEARFHSWFDLPIIGICITSPTKGWLEVNDHLCAMLGYEREEFAGLTWPDLTHPDDLTADAAQFERVMRGEIEGYSLEKRFLRKDRGIIQSELAVRCVRGSDAEVDYFVALINDITERKQAEVALRESEARYATTLAAVNDGLWDWDVRSGNAFFSPLYYALLGYEDQEFPANYASWRLLVHPEDIDRTEGELQQGIESGEGFTIDLRMKMKAGEWRWVSTRGKTVARDAEGKAVRLVGTLSDITERKRAENELQLIYAEMARFTYTVSHDLKSPLVTVKTFLGYLQEDLRKNDAAEVATDLGYINNAADKMARLLDELLELSRIGRKANPSQTAALQTLAGEAMDLVAGRLSSRGVQVDLTQEPIQLFGDRQRLMEIFQNLLDNAAKFMGEQPSPRIEIGVESSGNEVIIFVRDNGIGIDQRHLSRLFGLFEKLDPEAEGSGIGLATVRRIVELHGGRIWVASDGPGTGTTFRFTLANTKSTLVPEQKP